MLKPAWSMVTTTAITTLPTTGRICVNTLFIYFVVGFLHLICIVVVVVVVVPSLDHYEKCARNELANLCIEKRKSGKV